MNQELDLSRARWFKSSLSNGQGGNCVEVASNVPGIVGVRDSKDKDGPVLTFTPEEWHAFAAGIRDGQFDL
ncbi:MAG TPA: DUF397 domain-containing protein [Streptosporangiaceae bacterium]|nr:DUF397 domain-containing protein [Streptosporangiaceae bacterium]